MSKKYNFIKALSIIHLFIPLTLHAQPGTLVTSFGDQGATIINIEDRVDSFSEVALGKNGEIIAAGYTRTGGNFTPSDFIVAKFDISGQLIKNFGDNGILRGSLVDSASHIIEAMVLDENENIYVGLSLSTQDTFQGYVLRFDRNGNLDTEFAEQGIYTLPNNQDAYFVSQLLVDEEGRLLIAAGNAVIASIVRLDETGALDTTFAEGGTMVLMNPTGFFRIYDIALLPDGKLLTTGQSYSNKVFSSTMIRTTRSGQLDSTYGGTGTVSTPVSIYGFQINAMVVLEDGKVLLTGFGHNGSYNDAWFLKYNANGQLDSAFGSDGIYVFPSDRSKEMYGLHVFSDHTILGVGARAMIKLNAQGSPDSTWGENGILQVTGEYIFDMQFVSDDDFVVAGTLNRDFYLGKYTTKDLSTAIYHQGLAETDVKVFQNPFSESLNIQYDLNQDSEVSMELYDQMGRKVQTLLSPIHRLHGSHYDEFRVDETLSKGPYFLRCSFDKSDRVIKVIKQ